MKRILLAEDDKNLSRSVDILLTLDGYEVISVYNGEEALNKLCLQKFDLLITDIVMPHLSGKELIREIRRINPHIPIMVVSGNLNNGLIEELNRFGVYHILAKPIHPPLFREEVQKIFHENGNN
ncbi:MAG: hypothetical protein Kow0042_16880 [Calditrichia bacterium]